MQLSRLQEIINETLKIGMADEKHTLAENPDIVLSLGKPTDNKHLRIVGAGVAGNMDGEPVMFLELAQARNPVADLHSMMSGILGEERATELLKGVRDEV